MTLFQLTSFKLTDAKGFEKTRDNPETEKRSFFETTYKIMYLLGFSLNDRNLSYLVYSNTVRLLIISMFCSALWYWFTAPWVVEEVFDSVNIIIVFSSMYKYVKLITNKEIFMKLASSMDALHIDLETTERKKLYDLWQKRNEAYLWLLIGLGTGTLIVWNIFPVVDDIPYNLMIPISLPFDYHTPLRYSVTYTAALVVFTYMAYFIMINDLIMQTHVMHLLCQFAMLNNGFRNILHDCCEGREDLHLLSHTLLFNTNDFKKKYVKELDNLIKQHQDILNNILKLRNVLSGPMLAQLVVSTVLISSVAFQVTMYTENYTKCLRSLLYLVYNMVVLFIICRWCEEVKIQICLVTAFTPCVNTFTHCLLNKTNRNNNKTKLQPETVKEMGMKIFCRNRNNVTVSQNLLCLFFFGSADIGEAVYCSGWERGAATMVGVQGRLLLIIARANKPLVLTAGGMYDLSVASFFYMIKTSYSALTLLLRLRHDND